MMGPATLGGNDRSTAILLAATLSSPCCTTDRRYHRPIQHLSHQPTALSRSIDRTNDITNSSCHALLSLIAVWRQCHYLSCFARGKRIGEPLGKTVRTALWVTKERPELRVTLGRCSCRSTRTSVVTREYCKPSICRGLSWDGIGSPVVLPGMRSMMMVGWKTIDGAMYAKCI
jgi:hypothetical protein